MRTSTRQFEIMVGFMEKHGDLTKTPPDPASRLTTLSRWEELTSLLNDDGGGDNRNSARWRKVWRDLKNNIKKKTVRLHQAAQSNDSKSTVRAKFTDLELRVINFIGNLPSDKTPLQDVGTIASDPASPESRASSPLELKPDPNNIDILFTEGGSSGQIQEYRLVVVTPPPPANTVDEELVESEEEQQSPAQNSRRSSVASLEPLIQQSGQTNSDHRPRSRKTHERRERVRRPSYMSSRHSEPASECCNHSDIKWREFKIQKHRDDLEIQREQIRIREMELEIKLQIHRGWQSLGEKLVMTLDKVINKFYKD